MPSWPGVAAAATATAAAPSAPISRPTAAAPPRADDERSVVIDPTNLSTVPR